jgi:hypothetical protein
MDRKSTRQRYTNAKGAIIPMHHAFKTLRFGLMSKLSVLMLPVLFCILVWIGADWVADVWTGILRYWMGMLYENGDIAFQQMQVVGKTINIPHPLLEAAIPTPTAVWISLIASLVLFWLSLFLPQSIMPFVYLIRAGLLVHMSASIYFIFTPDSFPYDIQTYVAAALTMGLYMMFLIPLVLTAVFYIFDFPLLWKVFITFATLAFMLIAIPHQYLLHAFFIHSGTYLFMPVLYFLFGVLLDVLMFIAFYSIGMSYQRKREKDLGRFA